MRVTNQSRVVNLHKNVQKETGFATKKYILLESRNHKRTLAKLIGLNRVHQGEVL